MNIKKRSRKTGRGGSIQSFAGIPRHVMRSKSFRSLTSSAIRVLIWLAFEYRGKNNGDLAATHKLAVGWGIRAKDTLTAALRELIAEGMIIKTREGQFINPGSECALYALTWAPIDECPGKNLEVSCTRTPPRIHWET